MTQLIFNPESLTKLMMAHGLSIPAFAQKISIHRNNVYDWLNGRCKPNTASLEKIMGAFGIDDANYFFRLERTSM